MMPIANMIENGVRFVSVHCICGHDADVDVSTLPQRLYVPELRSRLRCDECGRRPLSVVPAWHTREQQYGEVSGSAR